MDATLRKFKNDAIAALGENIVCLLHHGSRAKGEAHAESDYDVIIIVKNLDEKVLKTLRNMFEKNPRFSTYLLSLNDTETLPRANLLQFMYAKPLYGEVGVGVPTQEEVRRYLSHGRRDW